MLEFENSKNFDRTKSIRIGLYQLITKDQLKQIFESYSIEWDKTEILFKRELNKIQFIYLICSSNEEAKKLYNEREKIYKTNENFDFNISSILDSLNNLIDYLKSKINESENSEKKFHMENFGLLAFPPPGIILNKKELKKKIPKKDLINKEISKIIENSLKLNNADFLLLNPLNQITRENYYNYILVGFRSIEDLNKFYFIQPFLNCLVFHKFTHLIIFPFYRIKEIHVKELCLICPKLRDFGCCYDLCSLCCTLQKENAIKIKLEEHLQLECNHISENHNNTSKETLDINQKNKKEKYRKSNEKERKSKKKRDKLNKIDYNNSIRDIEICSELNHKNEIKEGLYNIFLCKICKEKIIDKYLICKYNLCNKCCCRNFHFKKVCLVHNKYSIYQITLYEFFQKIDSKNNNLNCNEKDNKKEISEMNCDDENSKIFDLQNFRNFVYFYNYRLTIIKLRISEALKNSNFSFFRPIHDRENTRFMLDMNREFQTVIDHVSLIRSNPIKITDRFYKIFTYQNEKLVRKKYDNFATVEGFDFNGEFFIEYDYHKSSLSKIDNTNNRNLCNSSTRNTNINIEQNNKEEINLNFPKINQLTYDNQDMVLQKNFTFEDEVNKKYIENKSFDKRIEVDMDIIEEDYNIYLKNSSNLFG